jgi:PAS domain S-box-containing protein
MSQAGIDLDREPGMAAAIARATRGNGVAATAPDGAVAGTRGLFLVAPAPNLIDEVLRPGYVVLFVPDATLRAAADTPGVQLAVGRATAPNPSGGATFHETFQQAGQQVEVSVQQQSPQGSAGFLPWIILGAGLVLAGFAGALGLNAGRRAQAQDELDRIFTLSPDLITVADFDGHFVRVNPAVEQVLGYTPEEFVARPYLELVHPEDREATAAEAAAISAGKTTLTFTNRYIGKDGAPRVLEWTMAPVVEDGLMYGVARDITARRRAELQLRRLADAHAALSRVATLVAVGTGPDALFRAVADEVSVLLECDTAAVVRFEADGGATVVGGHRARRNAGVRFQPDPGYVVEAVLRTGRAARFDTDDPSAAGMPEPVRAEGIHSGLASPIIVADRLWGAITAASLHRSLPDRTEERLADFTELVGTAIANAESHAELLASRSRIVTTADQTRRRIERDLHDGAQQRLVTLTMKLRALEEAPTPPANGLSREVAEIAAGLDDVLDDLRETARGLHPVMLTRGGLGPALKGLARRSPVPVELDVRTQERLSEPVEVAAYYVVAEALTNAAKHAHASLVRIEADVLDGDLRVSVQDDGVGGADPADGSGLVGLADRVEALGGRLTLHSPPAAGTTVRIDLPLS